MYLHDQRLFQAYYAVPWFCNGTLNQTDMAMVQIHRILLFLHVIQAILECTVKLNKLTNNDNKQNKTWPTHQFN